MIASLFLVTSGAALLLGAMYLRGRLDEREAIRRRGCLRAEGLLARKASPSGFEHVPEFYRERFQKMRDSIPVDDRELNSATPANAAPRTPRAKFLQRSSGSEKEQP